MNPVLQARLQRRDGQLRTSFAEHDGKLIIAQSQDCTAIVEHCKQQHALGHVGSADFKHAGAIPDVILNAYMNKTGVSYRELMSNPVHFKTICNDPDNAAFRIWKGRV